MSSCLVHTGTLTTSVAGMQAVGNMPHPTAVDTWLRAVVQSSTR
ncbi:hypothetical protein NQU36_27270 [Escherichia coli]|nr:hypothetical protein [Escherichia coli]MCQ8811684.1 hypothetical protein [Escherichia coli]